MKYFNNQEFKNCLDWLTKLNKEKICKDFLNKDNTLDDIIIVFNINGINDDYYDIPLKNLDCLKEEILYCLQTDLEMVDENMNIIEGYPDTLYLIDIYIENRNNGFKMLYGTYYPEGFNEKYEIV